MSWHWMMKSQRVMSSSCSAGTLPEQQPFVKLVADHVLARGAGNPGDGYGRIGVAASFDISLVLRFLMIGPHGSNGENQGGVHHGPVVRA